MSEQQQEGKASQPEEPKEQKKAWIVALLPGEIATLERATSLNTPREWNVVVETPGRDSKLVRATYPMDAELQITGIGDATLIIPETVGKNADDKIPRIWVRSDKPSAIIGGDFILTGGTALIPVSPNGFLAENKPTLNDGEKDPRLEKDSVSLRFDADKDSTRGVRGDMRTVTVEREAETNIIFIDPATRDPKDPKSTPKEFYRLSALDPQKSIEDYNALIANRAREAERGKDGAKKEPPKETRNLKPLTPTERDAVRQSLADARTTLQQLSGSSFASDADLQGLITLSNEIIVGNTLDKDKLNAFRTKLDDEINKAVQNASPIGGGLNRIRDKLDQNDSLKISMNEQLPRDTLAAATSAAREAAGIIIAQSNASYNNKSPLQTAAEAQGLAGRQQA